MPLRIPRAIKRVAVAFAITVAVIGAADYYAITPHRRPSAPHQSDESLLFQADTLSWGNRWEDALPLYRRAQQLFLSQHNASKALYAEVSEILPDESISIRQPILRLPRDLATPEAQDPETKLRVLTIRGMLEVNYEAEARSTWQEVKTLALKLLHVAVATRAQGEQGIAAFLLGDTDTAKKLDLRTWGLSTALSIYEMQLIPAPGRCSRTEKQFARGVKKRLPQAAYIVDAKNRDILERVELERDSAFQYGRLLLDAGRGAFRSVSPTFCEEESMLVLPCSHSPCRSRPGTSVLDFNQRF